MRPKRKQVIIAAGGTGGHVFPGIAVAEELKKLDPSLSIVFAGTARGLESDLLPKAGWPLILLGSQSLKDRGAFGKAMAILRLPFSVLHAIAMFVSERPDLVVSIGGYAAAPIVFAAWVLRIPIVMVEPNAIAGMTNRKLGRFATKVFVAFDRAKGYFPHGRSVVTGAPIRTEVARTKRNRRDGKTIFVFGGSQGAMTINKAMSQAARQLGNIEGVKVIHQTGNGADPDKLSGTYRSFGVEADVKPFCERIWECYGEADLVVARSGANTVAEVAALGIPSILVPYPHAADDHQTANAMELVEAGGAKVIDDSECTGDRIAREVADLLGDSARLEEMAKGARSVGHPEAAKTIANECMNIMKAGER